MILSGEIRDRGKIHFIGIGGIGMSGLAEYFLRSGYTVSGSDILPSVITDRLKKLGANIFARHSSEHVGLSVGLVVYSSAVDTDNPELKQARKLKIKTLKRSEMLAEIVNEKYLIAVSGTHGKTTTTAMIGKVLIDSGLDPLVFVGGNVSHFNGGASRYGSGNYAVVEADEYDRSFLELKPDIAVVTNIDEDHLDIYKDLSDIVKNFKNFCDNSKENARIIFCGDDINAAKMIPSVDRENFSYGFGKSNYFRIDEYRTLNDKINFSIQNSHGSYKDISIDLIGKHNALNTAASFAVSRLLNIGFDSYRSIIRGFKTVSRRLQLRYDKRSLKVYDDYAHHPREIASSLSGLRELYPTSRLILVFQPHLYSRTGDFYKEFAQELSAADEIILTDIYPARETPIKGVSSSLIYDELAKKNKNSNIISDKQKVLNYLIAAKLEGDIIVFQGAGDITDLCTEFLKIIDTE